MTYTFSGNAKITLQANLVGAPDLGSAGYNVNYGQVYAFAQGNGANQAKLIWSDTRTLTASSSESLELTSSLVDAYGNTVNFTAIKGIIINAHASNTNLVQVGGAASDAFINWVASYTDIVNVRPGGTFALFANDATGYAVTASTGDLLKIANSSSGSSVTYDIILLGNA